MEFLRSAYKRVDQSLIAPTINALRRISVALFRTAQRDSTTSTGSQVRTLGFSFRSPPNSHHPTSQVLPSIPIPEVVRGSVRSPTSKRFGKHAGQGMKRRQPRRRALLIACGYYDSPEADMKLSFSWKDVFTTWKLLTSEPPSCAISLLTHYGLQREAIEKQTSKFLWTYPLTLRNTPPS
jgi:hypothetical protein